VRTTSTAYCRPTSSTTTPAEATKAMESTSEPRPTTAGHPVPRPNEPHTAAQTPRRTPQRIPSRRMKPQPNNTGRVFDQDSRRPPADQSATAPATGGCPPSRCSTARPADRPTNAALRCGSSPPGSSGIPEPGTASHSRSTPSSTIAQATRRRRPPKGNQIDKQRDNQRPARPGWRRVRIHQPRTAVRRDRVGVVDYHVGGHVVSAR